MRFPRTSLLDRLGGPGAPNLVLLEAPAGFGKSWLARKATPPGALRSRGDLSPLDGPWRESPAVVIDDAHLLTPSEVDRLAEFIEDAADSTQLVVAGRYLADELHSTAHLVDGGVFDAAALSVSVDDVMAQVPDGSVQAAGRVVEAAEGAVWVVGTALDQTRSDATADPVVIAGQLVRSAAAATAQRLGAADTELVSLLARVQQLDRYLLDKVGGLGFFERIVAAGVPLRRMISGVIEIGNQDAYRAGAVDSAASVRLANELIARHRPIDAAGLLFDAGAHDRAARMLVELHESIVDTIEPRALIAVLARLGTAVDADPALLILRAAGWKRSGHLDRSSADVTRALELVGTTDSHLRRRISVWHADNLWMQGRLSEAEQAATEALRNVGPGEELILATAHHTLADIASSSDSREDLQRAAEEYRIAIDTWESVGENARARRARRNLAMAAYAPLGRFDEAMAQLAQVLAGTDLSDEERVWTIQSEGYVLYGANRLDSAENRFVRVADIGQLHDSPQLIASAAWGRAMVAARREDLNATLRWIHVARNTALGDTDDVLGVPFLCDIATILGGLGELDEAAEYLAAAAARAGPYPDRISQAEFLLAARQGRPVDVDAQLGRTPPVDQWQVILLGALSAAANGDPERARHLLAEAERELIRLGLSDFRLLGERRAYEELQALLAGAPAAVAAPPPGVTPIVPAPGRPIPSVVGRRLVVIGGPMIVESAGGAVDEIPVGNPQRLLGAIVAHGGSATFDQLSDAIWPGEDVETSRTRLRNVLLRLRRGAGDVVVRSGSGVRLAPDVRCDLLEFERLANDALTTARSDPDLAGRLASEAVAMMDGPIFADFEYDEWAMTGRQAAERQLIGLLDLLSVQAEDAGDLPRAQALAERALHLDRYRDSRYVRLAELLTLQERNAAALAVLQDAAEVSRELGGALPAAVSVRRDDLIRRAATS